MTAWGKAAGVVLSLLYLVSRPTASYGEVAYWEFDNLPESMLAIVHVEVWYDLEHVDCAFSGVE